MTTEARAEAERRYPADQSAPYRVRPCMLTAFEEGAAWQATQASPMDEAVVRRDERAKAYSEWFATDPILTRGFWMVPCDDGCVGGVYQFPAPDGGQTCVRCRGTGYTFLSMADPYIQVD